ncbi:hypothetical protein BV898_16593 [Hypsibius exemplaris]|uniref:Uncharacterized protein n=1 Tax=Hypsibius exemplaris TaxID=2072580 RepID=A0A9X6RLS5_HYPEX|nr:hypothetical protein BV898_16593 [Hypsibius exemplaris]
MSHTRSPRQLNGNGFASSRYNSCLGSRLRDYCCVGTVVLPMLIHRRGVEGPSNIKNCADPFNSAGIPKTSSMDGKPCVACGSMTVTTVEGKLQTVRMCNVENTPGAEAWNVKTDNCNGGPVSALPRVSRYCRLMSP